MSKSCLNCVKSGFVIEKHGELYRYEGECNYHENIFRAPAHATDDREELRELVNPIFEDTANKCEDYERTGTETADRSWYEHFSKEWIKTE